MIDGIIETLFSGANVSADVRDAYLLVHRHLTEDALEVKDFKRIANAMEFAMKNQFCDSCSRESQRVLTSVLIKATTASRTAYIIELVRAAIVFSRCPLSFLVAGFRKKRLPNGSEIAYNGNPTCISGLPGLSKFSTGISSVCHIVFICCSRVNRYHESRLCHTLKTRGDSSKVEVNICHDFAGHKLQTA